MGVHTTMVEGTTMTDRDFLEFVERKTALAKSEKAVDWDKRKADWLRELEELYVRMEDHLKPYAGDIEIERKPIQLREDDLGTYGAEELILTIGYDKIVAKPIGTRLVGAIGRVDLSGPRTTLKIVLFGDYEPTQAKPAEANGVAEGSSSYQVRRKVKKAGWYIARKLLDTSYEPFSKDSFREAIMEVSGG